MKTGVSEKIITPEVGIELCGYGARIQPSIGRYDDLYAKVLYMENNGRKIVWVHCDLIGFSNEISNRIRKVLSKKLSVGTDDVFLSATHTHAGPATVVLRKCGDVDPGYVKFLEKTILESAKDASGNMEEVKLFFAETTLDGVAKDRRKASGNSHVDNKLPVLAFSKNDGSFKAVIANYGMHNVGFSSANRHISSDIAGFAAKLASDGIEGKPVVFMTNGGCGNINPVTMSEDYSAVQKAGTILGNGIVSEISKLGACGDCGISSSFCELELPLEILSIDELDKLRDEHRRYYESREDNYINNRVYEAMCAWYDESKELIKRKNDIKPAMAHIHLLKIGPVIFAGINAEVFSKMAEQLRKATGLKQLYVVGYTDGCIGYLAPEEIYEEGGYEVDSAHKFYGHFRLKSGGFEMVEAQLIKMINH